MVASEKGVVVGRLSFREDGDLIDCRRMGVGGKAIPPNVDKVSDIQSDATFILLVEKDAAFMRLVSSEREIGGCSTTTRVSSFSCQYILSLSRFVL